MRASLVAILRIGLSVFSAALLGGIAWLVGDVADILNFVALWVLLWLAALSGLGASIGYTLALPSRKRRAWLPWSLGAVAVALPYGALLGGAAARNEAVAPLGVLALVSIESLALALLAGHAMALQTRFSGLVKSVVVVATGVLHGYIFGLGYGVAWAIFYHPLCTPHMFCIEPDRALGLHTGLLAGPIFGLALGVTLAVALAAGYGARWHEHGPRAAGTERA